MGSWIGSFKNYFNEVQREITDVESSIEEEISPKKISSDQTQNKNKDEQ